MTASPTKPVWTDSGIPVESDKHSLAVGPDPRVSCRITTPSSR
jgi:hypothetical protein